MREMIFESARQVRDSTLQLDCKIYGLGPVQADGRLIGHPLCFRARHAGWSFTLCVNADVDPSALMEGRTSGFFDDGEFRGYVLFGDYGTDHDASDMPYAEAERIIRACAEQFLAESSAQGGVSAAQPHPEEPVSLEVLGV